MNWDLEERYLGSHDANRRFLTWKQLSELLLDDDSSSVLRDKISWDSLLEKRRFVVDD